MIGDSDLFAGFKHLFGRQLAEWNIRVFQKKKKGKKILTTKAVENAQKGGTCRTAESLEKSRLPSSEVREGKGKEWVKLVCIGILGKLCRSERSVEVLFPDRQRSSFRASLTMSDSFGEGKGKYFSGLTDVH